MYEELKAVRNVHAAFSAGLAPGLMYAGLTAHVLRGEEAQHQQEVQGSVHTGVGSGQGEATAGEHT